MSLERRTDWQDKVAVVTGAASGIGRGLAEHAADLGMKLVLADIDGEALENVTQSMDTDVLSIVTDVSDRDAVEYLAEETYARFDRTDLLFNNANIMAAGFSWEIDSQQFQRALDINVNGVINGARAFVPRMKRQGGAAYVVNTASIGGLLASPLMAPYSVSQFAVVAFSESLHAEVALLQLPIQVSVLCPGPVTSEMFKNPLGRGSYRPEVSGFVQQLQQHLDADGISPAELARRAFAGVEAGEFWLIPQPEALRERYPQRIEKILEKILV